MFSAATLHRAGVKFVLGSRKNLFEIKFDGGVLEMPQISIEGDTEMLLRNLQAFEQCHCSTTDHYVNPIPNIFLMATLLESPKDVELLAQKGIIENLLRNNEGVSNLFHRLDQENAIVASNFCFRDLVEDLNAYCKNPWHKWKAILRQDYFKNSMDHCLHYCSRNSSHTHMYTSSVFCTSSSEHIISANRFFQLPMFRINFVIFFF